MTYPHNEATQGLYSYHWRISSCRAGAPFLCPLSRTPSLSSTAPKEAPPPTRGSGFQISARVSTTERFRCGPCEALGVVGRAEEGRELQVFPGKSDLGSFSLEIQEGLMDTLCSC